MHYGIFALLLLVAVSMSQAAVKLAPLATSSPPANNNNNSSVLPAGDLIRDLNDLAVNVPMKAINRLVLHYLLTDEEFQAIIRAINSPEVIFWLMRLKNTPDLLQLQRWLRLQRKLSPVSKQWDDGDDLSLIDPAPFWYQSSPGALGFLNELAQLLPLDTLQQQIQLKVSQSAVFAELVSRIRNLQPAYERAINEPVAQRLWSKLLQLGIDVDVIDVEIRALLGWPKAAPQPVGRVGPVAPVARRQFGFNPYGF